jgi:hypothetical protein
MGQVARTFARIVSPEVPSYLRTLAEVLAGGCLVGIFGASAPLGDEGGGL